MFYAKQRREGYFKSSQDRLAGINLLSVMQVVVNGLASQPHESGIKAH